MSIADLDAAIRAHEQQSEEPIDMIRVSPDMLTALIRRDRIKPKKANPHVMAEPWPVEWPALDGKHVVLVEYELDGMGPESFRILI